VDLCYLLRRLGLTGGLKHVERQLGISRRPEVKGLDGLDATRLWREYRRGSREALDLLLTYNKEDVVNMEALLAYGCAEMARRLNFAQHCGKSKSPPSIFLKFVAHNGEHDIMTRQQLYRRADV